MGSEDIVLRVDGTIPNSQEVVYMDPNLKDLHILGVLKPPKG